MKMKFKDGYKVAHIMAMENLFYDEQGTEWLTFQPYYLYLYFKDSKFIEIEIDATDECNRLYQEVIADDDFCPVLEYGIISEECDYTWKEVEKYGKSCKQPDWENE
jgi:hypothetical protein